MKGFIIGCVVLLATFGGAKSEALNTNDSTRKLFVSLKSMLGDWYRWEDNPQVFDTWLAPGIITDGKIWSCVALSDNIIMFAGRASRNGRLWDLHVFESADGAVKLCSYHRDLDGALHKVNIMSLDVKASKESFMLWRSSDGQVARFLFSGEGKSLRMNWDTWDKNMGVWNKKCSPFRRDPPPGKVELDIPANSTRHADPLNQK